MNILPTCRKGHHDHLHSVMSMHCGRFFLSFFKCLYSWCRLDHTKVINIQKILSISGRRFKTSLSLYPVTVTLSLLPNVQIIICVGKVLMWSVMVMVTHKTPSSPAPVEQQCKLTWKFVVVCAEKIQRLWRRLCSTYSTMLRLTQACYNLVQQKKYSAGARNIYLVLDFYAELPHIEYLNMRSRH